VPALIVPDNARPPAPAVRSARAGSPRQVAFFWQSAQVRSEAAILAGFFRLFGPLPLTPTHDARAPVPGLAQGEQLCRSYERFRSLVPDSLITFEHAVLLLLELARAVDLRLDVCADCRVALVLVDEFATGRPLCAHCARRTSAREGAIGTLMQANSGLSEQLPEPATTGLQGGLF